MPLKNQENVCVFYKKLPTYNPQGTIMIEPKEVKKMQSMKVLGDRVNTSLNKKYIMKKKNFPKSVIEFPRDSKTFHPTQKPLSLFEYLVKTYTNEGDTVLDNCMGAFTTAVACDNTNRNWIGFELNAEYCEQGALRVNDNRANLDLEAVEVKINE